MAHKKFYFNFPAIIIPTYLSRLWYDVFSQFGQEQLDNVGGKPRPLGGRGERGVRGDDDLGALSHSHEGKSNPTQLEGYQHQLW